MAVWPTCGRGLGSIWQGQDEYSVGAGMAYSLLDNIGYCCRTVNPLFSTYVITPSPFPYQQDPAAAFPAGLPVTKGGTQGGGIQPDAQPATTVHYRFEIEQRFGVATSLRLTYNGSHGYHDILRADANTVIPTICSRAAANCPAGLMDGTKYFPAGTLRPNPQLNSINQYFTSAVNPYNAARSDPNPPVRGGNGVRS